MAPKVFAKMGGQGWCLQETKWRGTMYIEDIITWQLGDTNFIFER